MLTRANGILRQVYRYAAGFALANMIAMIGLVLFAAAGGFLDAGRLRQAVTVLRGGELTQSSAPQQGTAPATVDAVQLAAATVDNAAPDAQMDVEILHREAERIKVELDQRLALNNSILLKVRSERMAFQNEREAAAKRDEEQRKLIRDEGFEKQVAIFESLSPKVAVQHLLGMNDPDAAAKILMAVQPDRARKIVEAAKRGPELAQMQVILQRVREAAPPSAALPAEQG